MIGGIALLLVLGCNNGEIEKLKNENNFLSSISNLGKGFLSVFTDLGDMVSDVLGIKADTKKEDIGKYFSDIAKTMESVKTKLQNEVSKNGNYERVKTVVDKFIKEKLDIIAAGAKEVASGAEGNESLGNMAKNAAGGKAGEVDKLIKGIKTIVDAVELKEGNPEAGNEKAATDSQTARTNSGDDAGHLFANNQAGTAGANAKKAANDAAKAVGAVSGADILKAISQGVEGKAAKLAVNKENHDSVTAVVNAMDATVAGAVALRAMAKEGKFAGNSSYGDAVTIVEDSAASAVNKALSTLVIAIRRTVDSGLKKINEALAAVNQGDMSSETGEAGAAKK